MFPLSILSSCKRFLIIICSIASDAPEAEVEEVLGSLKLRILRMFKWARSEVSTVSSVCLYS